MESTLLNLICAVLAVSGGAIIMRVLKNMRLFHARRVFCVLFAVVLFYFPFYFFSGLTRAFFTNVFNDDVIAGVFVKYVTGSISLPFIIIKTLSITAGFFAIAFSAASIITAVYFVMRAVRFLCGRREFERRHAPLADAARPVYSGYKNNKYRYLVLSRLRN